MSTKDSLSRRVQVMLTPDLYARLERRAVREGTSVSALVRRAVEREFVVLTVAEKRRIAASINSMSLPVADWETMERESQPGLVRDDSE
jgi:hypothetical protein